MAMASRHQRFWSDVGQDVGLEVARVVGVVQVVVGLVGTDDEV